MNTSFFKETECIKPEECDIYNVYNDIQFKMTKLFIDTRNENEYNKKHIRSAVNIPLSSFDLFRLDSNLLQSKIDSFIARKLYHISKIIFYGNKKYDKNDSIQQLFYQRCIDTIIYKLNSKNNNNDKNDKIIPKIMILNCSYNDFENKYGFLCNNKQSATDPNTDANTAKSELLLDFLSIYMNRKFIISDDLKIYPSQILNDQYFIGNANHSSDIKILKNLNITHIVNCTQTLPNLFINDNENKNKNKNKKNDINSSTISIDTSASYEDNEKEEEEEEEEYKIKYIRVAVNDVSDQNIIQYFVDAIKFIENALSDKSSKLLCHCHAGISRSTTITIAYLMYSKNLSFIDSLKFIKTKREIVNPNQGFRAQLCSFEQWLKTKRKLLNKTKLTISDLNDFSIEQNNKNNNNNNNNTINEENIDYLYKEFRNYVFDYFNDPLLSYENVYNFLEKYSSMINNQFPEMIGILIEDIFLNQCNKNRQLFISLIVELFKTNKISNNNNNFVDNVLCGYIAKDFHDNLIDSPYFLQFIASLIAQLLNQKCIKPQSMLSFIQSSSKYHKIKILNQHQFNGEETENNPKILKQQFELIKFQCSKLILYVLKELNLLGLQSVEIISMFKDLKINHDIISINAFQTKSDKELLAFLTLK